MNNYLVQLFDLLNNHDNSIIIMTVYLSLFALACFLRFAACTAWRTALFAFRLDAKEIKNRDDIKKIRSNPLKKIVTDYIKTAEKNVSRIPTQAMVDRHIFSLSLLGWRYVSIQIFVEALETGLVLIGLILAVVFNEFAFVYGLLSAAGFVLARLMAAFFDFKTAQRVFTDELVVYVEREIGHFYAADTSAVVTRLKNDLVEASARQTGVFKTAIEQLSAQLSASVTAALRELSIGTVDMADSMQKPLQDWNTALTNAGHLQTQINTAGERLFTGAQRLVSAADLLAKYLQGHSHALSDQLNTLVSAIDALKESNMLYAQDHEAFLKQAKYIEQNQSVLEASLQSYEATLQNLTGQMGDGLGVFVQLHAQQSAQTANEALQTNLGKITGVYQETMRRMTALFEQLREQNKDIAAHLLSLHEKLTLLEKHADAPGGKE